MQQQNIWVRLIKRIAANEQAMLQKVEFQTLAAFLTGGEQEMSEQI